MIRLAADGDIPALARLRREFSAEMTGSAPEDPEFEDRFAEWMGRIGGDRLFWVADDDGELVGMLNLSVFERMPSPGREPSCWGYVGNVFVLSAYRNAGVGRDLLDAALAYADAQGFARVVLAPSELSVPLYRRAGFTSADMLMARIP